MKEHKSVWMQGLTSELKKKAEVELKETPENRARALMELRKLISEKPDFYCEDSEDFLIKFLRGKKYDVKRAFTMLQNYYSYKFKYPYAMSDSIRDILSMNNMFVPPVRMLDGSSLFVVFIGKFDLDKYPLEEYFKAAMICTEQTIETEASQVCGGHLIIDFTGMSFSKLRHFSSPSFLNMLAKGLESCWPYRMVSGHGVHEPFYISVPYNLFSSMLSKKLRERIHFHGNNLDSLHKLIPRECLPEQLGGVFGDEAFQRQREIIISRQLETEKSIQLPSADRKPSVIARKQSHCSSEEKTDFLQCKNSMSKVAF